MLHLNVVLGLGCFIERQMGSQLQTQLQPIKEYFSIRKTTSEENGQNKVNWEFQICDGNNSVWKRNHWPLDFFTFFFFTTQQELYVVELDRRRSFWKMGKLI